LVGDSAGDRAKFGLTIPEILQAVEQLQAANMLGSLQLLSYWFANFFNYASSGRSAGSKPDLCGVARLENMRYLDVGGGLGVDYDGSKTNFMLLKLQHAELTNDVVGKLKLVVSRDLPVPTLIE